MLATAQPSDEEVRAQLLAELEEKRAARRKEVKKAYDQKTAEWKREYLREWYLKNRERKHEYERKRRALQRKQRRDFLWVSSDYMASPRKPSASEYDRLLTTQNGQCAICGISSSDGKQRLCVDHDHATGRVRGLLCFHCNVMLGHAKDKTEILLGAAKYLEAS